MRLRQSTISLAHLAFVALADAACGPAPSGSVRPSVASGYSYQVVATGLSTPRGIAFDTAGNLLVVQSGTGLISAHALSEENGCLSVTSSVNVTPANKLNHGIDLSPDGKTLYASSDEAAYAYDYDATKRASSNQRALVTNLTGTDHSTRTLLASEKAPGQLIVSFGSRANLDPGAASVTNGSASVKAFDLNTQNGAVTYDGNGKLLGWGLRNEVGIGEHPVTGGIWGVENSADQIMRYGVDVHATNPGEELNFLGYLNGTSTANQGSNFGYPWCFAAWNTSALPQNGNLSTGDQFAINADPALDNQNRTDSYCAGTTRPRLVFHSHMAPLDIKFNNTGHEAWISFHGSWNSPSPVGYKVSMVDFTDAGEPVESPTSNTAAKDILSNLDNSVCPGSCFRPATMAIDGQGRIFMSSDSTGEIYVISKDVTSNGTASSSNSSSTGTSGGGSTGSASSKSSASMAAMSWASMVFASVLCILICMTW